MPVALLLEAIALLVVALCAPAWLIARVAGFGRGHLARLQRGLRTMQRHGWRLRYGGEDEATAVRRFDRLAWIAKDPVAAMKHILRRCRNPVLRARFAMVAPACDAPPALQIAALRDGSSAVEADDSS